MFLKRKLYSKIDDKLMLKNDNTGFQITELSMPSSNTQNHTDDLMSIFLICVNKYHVLDILSKNLIKVEAPFKKHQR